MKNCPQDCFKLCIATKLEIQADLCQSMNLVSTVQSWFSDIEFSDNLWFSDYFTKTFLCLLQEIIQFSDIMLFSDSFCDDQKCH